MIHLLPTLFLFASTTKRPRSDNASAISNFLSDTFIIRSGYISNSVGETVERAALSYQQLVPSYLQSWVFWPLFLKDYRLLPHGGMERYFL